MEVNQLFEKFYKNILLTSKQKKDAITKYTGVCKKLHDYYYPDVEYNGNTKLLIGSYRKQTHIRPARDIDVIFIMPPEKFEQYDDNQSNGQSQLLQDIKKILEKKYTDTPIKAFGKVVVLKFADTKHNVELLPAWEKKDDTFTIPNSENDGYWENWDVRAELDKISDTDKQSQGYAKKLIRMLKKWTDHCSVKIQSVHIEEAVLNYYAAYGNEEKRFSELIKDVFNFLKENTHDENKSHVQTAYNRAKKAVEFVENNKISKAIEEWHKIFGDDFSKCENNKSFEVNNFIDQYPSHKEQSLLDLNITEKLMYNLKINAKVMQRGFRPHLLTSVSFLRKELWLEFFIERTNATGNYEILWKVKNQGEEAKSAEDLRGEITYDTGNQIKKEHTLYDGTHYVECYFVRDTYCVAKNRIYIKINQN